MASVSLPPLFPPGFDQTDAKLENGKNGKGFATAAFGFEFQPGVGQ